MSWPLLASKLLSQLEPAFLTSCVSGRGHLKPKAWLLIVAHITVLSLLRPGQTSQKVLLNNQVKYPKPVSVVLCQAVSHDRKEIELIRRCHSLSGQSGGRGGGGGDDG